MASEIAALRALVIALEPHIVVTTQGPHQGHALGCAEGQIESVDAALPERAAVCPVGSYAVVEPTRD